MKAKRIAFLAVSTALGMILAYVEAILIPSFGIPGVKVGLANLATVFLLYRAKPYEALISGVLRVVLIAVLFGNWVSLVFSFSGLIASVGVMWLLKRVRAFSVAAVSVSGAVVHNLIQILVAVFFVGAKEVVYYLPVLILGGVGFGLVIGIVSSILVSKVPDFHEKPGREA